MNAADEKIVELFFNVARSSRTVSESLSKTLPLLGQYRCMFLLETAGPINQRSLAEALQIRPASLSELLSKLDKKGYIKRTANERDKRSLLVSLTKSGAEKVREYRMQRAKFHSNLLSPLTEEEKQQFYCILLKMHHHINSEEKNHDQ